MQKTEVKNARNLVFRKYQEGDEALILSLLKLVLKQSLNRNEELLSWVNPEYWNRMYKNNPAGNSMVFLAESAEKLVGHYALVPMRMLIEGKERIGTIAINIVIHPEYQGQGIFTTLVNQAAQEMSKERVPITFVFPNRNSYPIFIKKLGWFEACLLSPLFRPVNAESILKRQLSNKNIPMIICGLGLLLFSKIFCRTKKYPVNGKINIKKISSFDERIDDFFIKASKPYKIITIRDKKYLAWRYINSPTNSNYTIYLAEDKNDILGYIILKSIEHVSTNSKGGVIMDILTLPDRKDVINSLITKTIEHFKENDAETIRCNIPKNNMYYAFLKKHGFIPDFFAKKVNQPRLTAHINTINLSKKFFIDSKNWFVTNGDRNDI